ncbi:hypothetical protein MTR67_026983, partial [Solanum verrucosum]
MTEVRSFVGLANYYRRFVKNFASTATHLINLTKKEIPFEWTEKCEESFQKLKTLLTTAPILALSVEGKYYIIYCDASHPGLGAVLMQDKNVIAYASRQLKVHERNYPTHYLELLAVVFALKIWRHYLYGVKCEVFIDHHSLQHVFTQEDLNLRHRRWMELLKALGISERGGVLANIEVRATFIEEINAKQFDDENLEELRKKTVINKAQETTLDAEGVLNFKGRICVPRVDCLIQKLLTESHGSRYSIHPCVTKMYRDLKRIHWWPGMKKDIAEFVAKCQNYQQVKYEHQRPADRSTQFTSKFWRKLHDKLGTQLTFSTTFHPQTEGRSERTIQVLEDMLRACVLDFGGNWDKFLPLCEFSYNNSYHSSIDMTPIEALNERKCISPIGWFEAGDVKPLGADLVKDAQDKVSPIKGVMRFGKQGQHHDLIDPMMNKAKPCNVTVLGSLGNSSSRIASQRT